MEVRLEDGTRCDLLTDTHAYEIEYDVDWKESIGQTLHYAHVTGRKAGVILIMHSRHSKRYLAQLKAIIKTFELPIEVVELCRISMEI